MDMLIFCKLLCEVPSPHDLEPPHMTWELTKVFSSHSATHLCAKARFCETWQGMKLKLAPGISDVIESSGLVLFKS